MDSKCSFNFRILLNSFCRQSIVSCAAHFTTQNRKTDLKTNGETNTFLLGLSPQVHEWAVYKLDALGSVDHKVKIHETTTVTGKERGDIEIRDYVVLQNPQRTG
jgi:hypothetical protein